MIAVWFLLTAAGFAVMIVAARRAATTASALAARSSLPPFVIGTTVLALGTDLPEIANSIIASATGHGDLNVGDSFGSVATQVTLILGLLPFIGKPIPTTGRSIPSIGLATIAALVVGAILFGDGRVSRTDAALLVLVGIVGSYLVYRQSRSPQQLDLELDASPRPALVSRTLVALAFLGAGATVAVFALGRAAAVLGVPEFVMSFFVASIGTSLPELAFNITAIRRGDTVLALGDVFGSSFLDATLSVAIGPLLFPTAITAHFAVRGALTAVGAVAIATLLCGRKGMHTRWSGAILLITYAAFYLVLL
jgi:cation:H+ antiporter